MTNQQSCTIKACSNCGRKFQSCNGTIICSQCKDHQDKFRKVK